jgi:hypothetical protein
MNKVHKYAGGHEFLRTMWPFEQFHPDEHVHEDTQGGYFNHTHEGGARKHTHQVEKPDDTPAT